MRNAAVHLRQADRKKVRDVELRNLGRQLLSMVRLFHANRSQVLGSPEKHFCFHLFFLQFSALFRHLGKSHLNCGKSFLPRSLLLDNGTNWSPSVVSLGLFWSSNGHYFPQNTSPRQQARAVSHLQLSVCSICTHPTFCNINVLHYVHFYNKRNCCTPRPLINNIVHI